MKSLQFLVERALGDSQASGGHFHVLIFPGESCRDVEALQFFQRPVRLIRVGAMYWVDFEGKIAGFQSQTDP